MKSLFVYGKPSKLNRLNAEALRRKLQEQIKDGSISDTLLHKRIKDIHTYLDK